MKKKKLTLLSAVAAAAVLAACTADELLSEGGKATRSVSSADPTPIMVSALVDNGDWEDVAVGSDELHPVGTRADQTLNEGSLSTTVQSMVLYAYGQSGNASGYTRYVLDSYNSSTKQFSATTMPVFPAGETSVNVYGWYPAMDSTPKTFQVQSDQSTNDNFIKSDLMLANQVSCTRSKNSSNEYTVTAAQLTFRHVLSKINMNITPGEGVTITQVVINGVNRTATINDGTKTSLTATCSGNGSDAITVYSGSYNTTSSALQISAVIPPQTLTNTFVTITANTPTKTSKTATYSLGSTGKSFATGKKYVMNLTVNQQDITTKAHDISAWSDATVSVTIEGNTSGGGGDIELSEYEKTLTVAGSSQTVTITGSGSYSVVSSNTGVATASVSGTSISISPVSAGVANVLVSNSSGEYGIVSVTVNKGTPTVTPPTAVSGTKTYNKSAQTLFQGGSTSGGTLQFALGTSSAATGSWSNSLPTATNAGTHYVWYRVVGNANYNDVAETKGVSNEIAKLTPTITLSPTSLSFAGATGATKTFTVSFDGDNTLSVASGSTSVATVSPASLSSSGGTVTVTSKGYGNATITVSAAATPNCNEPTNKTVAVTSINDPGVALYASTVGMIVGANGKAYNSRSDMSGFTDAVAVVVYKIGGSGYAISLVDATRPSWNDINEWEGTGDDKIVPYGSYINFLPSPPSGFNWLVLSKDNYSKFIPNGYGDINGYISSADGNALSGDYWSCSEYDSERGWSFCSTHWYDPSGKKAISHKIRPCLAF
ncbi:MAG: fimbrillin family protein [Bacteroidaceae bacterium]|nr:fimbrillin family protein [Bacteroidaceae bacterium]